MTNIVLTQYNGAILGPIARLLGYLMDAIFNFCEMIGFANIGLAIVLFTIIINLLLLPLTFKQQKFSKMNSVMNPELQKIAAKYKGKTDQESMQRQQQEQRAVYEKYGVSMSAGCMPLLIQMPILLALYRVIYNIPGYVTSIKDVFMQIANVAITQDGFVTKIADLAKANNMPTDKYLLDGSTSESLNYVVDLFYKFDLGQWNQFKEIFPSISDQIQPQIDKIMSMNTFFGGISLAEAPGFRLSIALIIPVLAWFTNWLNVKLMTAANPTPSSDNAAMNSTMKSMNTFMPLMSGFFCITVPAGLGIYWIASAVVRILQQLGINAYMKNISVEDIVKKNREKQNKKREKQGLPPLTDDDFNSGKNSRRRNASKTSMSSAQLKKKPSMPTKIEKNVDSTKFYQKKDYKSGSIASKARMVQDYDDKKTNNK
ncbi:essential for sigma-G activity at stage III [Lachnospiraceae bacterium TWA4]|nr:essential for sigma-G activity at stage III [Lachnospiraceae bacterium TWA4]